MRRSAGANTKARLWNRLYNSYRSMRCYTEYKGNSMKFTILKVHNFKVHNFQSLQFLNELKVSEFNLELLATLSSYNCILQHQHCPVIGCPAMTIPWLSSRGLIGMEQWQSVRLQKTGRLYTVEPTDQYPSVHSEMTQWQRPMINRGSGCQGITREAPHRQIRRLGGCVVINDRRYRNWPGKLLTSLAQHRGIDLR